MSQRDGVRRAGAGGRGRQVVCRAVEVTGVGGDSGGSIVGHGLNHWMAGRQCPSLLQRLLGGHGVAGREMHGRLDEGQGAAQGFLGAQ